MGYQGRGKMIRFEIPVLDVFLLSGALKCATNRHKIKDYADVMRIMNYRKLFESEAHKHSEEPPAPPANEYRKAMTEYINKSDFIKWIESTFCKPCKEKGDDRDGVCCRVCQYNDWIAYVDSFQGGNDY